MAIAFESLDDLKWYRGNIEKTLKTVGGNTDGMERVVHILKTKLAEVEGKISDIEQGVN